MTFSEWAISSLKGSHYRDHYYEGLETQFQPVQDDDALDRYGDPAHPPYKWRLPDGGKTYPVDNDRPMDYAGELVDIWGTSWWDYKRALTIGCMWDIDLGHGPRGKTAEEIADWDRRAATIPYLMNSTSKGGGGRHGNAFLDNPLPAATRAEHKRNCRAITACVSAALGLDLFTWACCWGGIQYIYARSRAENGLTVVTPATEKLVLPDHWLEIVTPWERATEAQSELLTSEAISHRVEMDAIHCSIGDTFRRHGYAWSEEEHKGRIIISLHLGGLKVDHKENKRPGVYDTNSPCTEKSKPNGFGFLKPNGGLALRRFGDAADVSPWYQGPSGIWCCDYNLAVTFKAACDAAGGVKGKKGIITFYDGDAIKALTMLGIDAQIPEKLRYSRIDLLQTPGKIKIAIHSSFFKNFDGWTYDYTKYVKSVEYTPPVSELPTFDERLRYTTERAKGEDWMLLDDRGHWNASTYSLVKDWIKGNDISDDLVPVVLKHHSDKNWLLQRIPFAAQYPGCRIWNRDGARFSVTPRPGDFKFTKMVIDHVGDGLTPYLDEWCEIQGIKTGGEYLMWWAARLFQNPKGRLPFLFFFSPEQNSGKSSFHRTLLRLFANTNGWCELRKELLKDDFNDLLRGCALAYLEEIDLSKSPTAYELIKNLVDGTVPQDAWYLRSFGYGNQLRASDPNG